MEQAIAEYLPAPPAGSLTYIADPFSTRNVVHYWHEGDTLLRILEDVQPDGFIAQGAVISVNGVMIRREYWHVCYPKPGALIVVKILPGDREIFRVVLQIAVAIGSLYVPGLFGLQGLAAASAQAATFAAGTLAVNAIVPPATPQFENGNQRSQQLSVEASRNRLVPFGVMPNVLGKIRLFPYFAAKPFTELQGDDQYVTMLFVVGYTNLEVLESSFKFGATDLNALEDVLVEIDTGGSDDTAGGITLFPDTPVETVVNTKLSDSSWVLKTTPSDAEWITYDIAFPEGLIRISGNGKDKDSITVTVVVQRSPTGAGTWTEIGRHKFTAKSASAIRKGFRSVLPSAAAYDIRMQRLEPDVDTKADGGTSDASVYNDNVYWSIFRSFKKQDPIQHANAAKIAIRIRATDQLSGTPDTFNCEAQSIVPDWTGGAWVAKATSNPASLARYVLTGNANARALATSRLVDADFQNFWKWCDGDIAFDARATKKEFNQLVDYTTTVWTILRAICTAGRARPLQIDGQWSVFIDRRNTTITQYFTPRNTADFVGTKVFPGALHAFRVRFQDEENNYESDERIVYADGFNSGNATKIEALELVGVTNRDQVWRDARYYIAVFQLRQEEFQFTVDVEQLVSLPGDPVWYLSDAIKVALGAGRVKSQDATTITFDAGFPTELGKTYKFVIRTSDGLATTVNVDTPVSAGTYSTFTMTSPPISPVVAVGDLAMFGESTGDVGFPMMVKDIQPLANLQARLTCIPLGDGIHDADTGVIPSYNPNITALAGAVIPAIDSIRSDISITDRSAAGNLTPAMVILFAFVGNRDDVHLVQVQYRPAPGGINHTSPWINLPYYPFDIKEVRIPGLTDGDSYEVRARYFFTRGSALGLLRTGTWSTATSHTIDVQAVPPPDLASINVNVRDSGIRVYTPAYSTLAGISEPDDHDGFLIRYWDLDGGANPGWSSMTAINSGGRITRVPFESNEPFFGDHEISAKAINTYGLESDAMVTVTVEFPMPNVGSPLAYSDERANGWTGSITSMTENPDTGYLDAIGNNTWTNATDWNGNPGGKWSWLDYVLPNAASPIYIGKVVGLNAGTTYKYYIDVEFSGNGTTTITQRVVGSGGGWTAFTDGDALTDNREIRVELFSTNPGGSITLKNLRIWAYDNTLDPIKNVGAHAAMANLTGSANQWGRKA